MTWVSDANYIDVGQTAEHLYDIVYGYVLHSLRVFPKPLEKSCYQLPVVPDVPYLLRLGFVVGSYSGFKRLPSFAFSIETPGMIARGNVSISDRVVAIYDETIFVSSGRVLYICLIRTSELDDPFISGIQLRKLKPGMYGQAKPGTMLMSPYRNNVGGDGYPQDEFDRIWDQFTSTTNSNLRFVSIEEPILTNDTKELPPPAVMQTAAVISTMVLFPLDDPIPGHRVLLLLYFAEIEKLNMSQLRSFYVTINDDFRSDAITIPRNYSTLELTFISNRTDSFYFRFENTSDATIGPILNAYEIYRIVDTQPATYAQDLKALEAIKSRFGIKDWISDPCFLIPWKGIVCESNFSPIRISEMSLCNNNFMGPFPNFSSLTMVEKLYCGNAYLQIPKGECILHNTKENKLKVVLGTTLTGIPIIALALIVAIIMYRNKFGKKEQGTVLEEERSLVPGEGMVPNPTKLGVFTLEEMIAATQSFSREIGRGGFGSVFLGELPRGRNIAVKVLSQFSQQGFQEFMNEVDLLSRIHHRNLVSLLGYCNQSKEVMLVYEYMPGGSLRDHIYGPRARHSNLNWRTRLKIALDAAQGLEYLHVGCAQKIIHRDIKTANILLDNNFNGKVADFGLSRITNDGEATHVTTAVKGTFGYLDPEYYNTQMLTEKSDVYSFGVVLLEIILGRAPIDPKLAEDEVNIIHWATPYLAEIDENGGTLTEIIDKMLGESYDVKSMTCVAKVATRCVQAGRSCRPSMSEVVAELKEAIKLEDLLAGQVDSSERQGMEWSDDSCNISNVGR
eukprot:PITA_24024